MKLELEHDAARGVVPIEGGISTCTTTTTCRGTTTSTTVSTN